MKKVGIGQEELQQFHQIAHGKTVRPGFVGYTTGKYEFKDVNYLSPIEGVVWAAKSSDGVLDPLK